MRHRSCADARCRSLARSDVDRAARHQLQHARSRLLQSQAPHQKLGTLHDPLALRRRNRSVGLIMGRSQLEVANARLGIASREITAKQNGTAGIPNHACHRSFWRSAVTTQRPLITYISVSTSQQGRSGLGIEAQRQTWRAARRSLQSHYSGAL